MTNDVKDVIQKANVDGSGINRTTPVWMYPRGASQPHEVMDMGGNVWEWQANFYGESRNTLAFRGGSWYFQHSVARVSARHATSRTFRTALRVSGGGPPQLSF